MSIDFFSKKYEDIKIFSKFLTEEFDIDDLIFFLFVRSCIEKELKIFFLEKSKENIKNFSNFDEVEQNNIFVPVKTCKKIGISIYGDNDDELLNKYYEKIKYLAENESLNNKKQFIKASSILSFSVEDYHNSRGTNDNNESEIQNFELEDKNNIKDDQENKNKTIDLEESNNEDLITNSKLQSIENLQIIEDNNENVKDENEEDYNNNIHKSEIKNKTKIPEINNFRKINNINNNNKNISKTSRNSNAKHLSNIDLPNPKNNKIIENKRNRKSSQNSNNNKTFSNSRNIVNGLKQINNKKMNVYNQNKIGNNNSFNRSINSARPSTINSSITTTNTSLKKNPNKINVNKINNNKLSNKNKINNIINNSLSKNNNIQKSKEFLQILTKFKADKAQTELEKKTTLKNIINEYCKIKELDNYFNNLINSNSLFNGLNSQINKTINNVKDSTLKKISVLNNLIASNESDTFLSFMKIKENDSKAKLNFKILNNSFNQMIKKEKLIFIDEQNLIDYINIIFNISEFNLQTTKLLLKNLD